MYIDTHCHVLRQFYDNIDEVIKRQNDNIIIISGDNDESNHEIIEIVKKYENVFGTIGIHPDYASEYDENHIKFIEENINNPKIVGIGEIGLDYYHNTDNKQQQKELFLKQIAIAKKYKKTIVVHSRDAIKDTYDIIKDSSIEKTVLHCYSSSLEMANEFIKLNTKFGIGGVVTFKNSSVLKKVVQNIDLRYLLLETDSPFLTPEPNRGKKNYPENCLFVAEKISELKEIPLEIVLKQTSLNAISQFDLPIQL